MRRFRLMAAVVMAAGAFSASAERHLEFSANVFNAVVGVSNTVSTVISPFACEMDFAVLSEAHEPVPKAKFIEALGALTGYDQVLLPVAAFYARNETNAFDLVSARAFLVPHFSMIDTAFRFRIREEFKVESCRFAAGGFGAECWFRAMLDGAAEDFRLPAQVTESERFSFMDLESFTVRWAHSFFGPGEGPVKLEFRRADGGVDEVEAMHAVMGGGGIWQANEHTMLCLPMAGGMVFYAFLPAEGVPLARVRRIFSGTSVAELLVKTRSVTEPGVATGPLEVTLPLMDVDTTVDLTPAAAAFRLDLVDFSAIRSAESPEVFSQRCRFRLGGEGVAPKEAVARPVRTLVFDRPFMFFIYHEGTRSMPVAGIYGGR